MSRVINTLTAYQRLKQTMKRSTAGYGSALTTTYFITQGAEQGISVALGSIASYVYISLLTDHVDHFEKSSFQKEFLAPIGAAAFEMTWNHAPFSFDFDYGATFVGFLAYKFALSTVLYETVREMMIPSNEDAPVPEPREPDSEVIPPPGSVD